ncbi:MULTISPECIES: 6-carboxytetrahydropterin synthase [unclassified Bradyrhizobium]|uniref:6-pyruvoyl trahydropterin synthase family protein n=1 Tax=unclassified Bradyrhizobium TaxID=2631580 RepID=UPI001CD80C42
MTYLSTKTYGHETGLSATFRQWRALSHCRLLHGYSLSFRFEFEADTLDDKNWVVDFGGLKELKAILEHTFDHKTVVAADNPELEWFQEAARRGGYRCATCCRLRKVCRARLRHREQVAADRATCSALPACICRSQRARCEQRDLSGNEPCCRSTRSLKVSRAKPARAARRQCSCGYRPAQLVASGATASADGRQIQHVKCR